jgi:hypothetical protein
MKKQQVVRGERKTLKLNVETLRDLTPKELQDAVGGVITRTGIIGSPTTSRADCICTEGCWRG